MTFDGRMFIDGARRSAAGNATVSTPDPSTGEVLTEVALGGAADVDEAVTGARVAQRQWRREAPARRAAILDAVADGLLARTDELADLESADVGKPISQARADVVAAAAYFRFYAGLADKILGTSIPVGPGRQAYTVREPVGVSAHIVPWNYPLQLSSRGIAPALACGNAVVVKPAAEAGLSVVAIAEIATAAGVPAGVFNVVTGDGGTGAAITAHDGVDHVTFTGSVSTGSAVMRSAADNVVPVTLELGGKSPMIVFADADLEAAAATTASVIVQNAGQTCSAASRLLVQDSVREKFLAMVQERLAAVRVGPGRDDPAMGPVISARQRDQVEQAVQAAVDSGATVLTGGERGCPAGLEGGFFYRPTLLAGVDPHDPIAQQEVFGPVLAALPFVDADEAIEIANGTPYGLVSGVWTTNLRTAHSLAQELECGQVFINGYGAGGGVALPFGGRGKSGFGREKGLEALHNYTATKNVMIHFEA